MNKFTKTFLDLPIDRELYAIKPPFVEKPPLRVLITNAGNKTAYCVIYKICTGEVFGPDQEVYIHLVNAKGVIDHKTIFLELEECGFHLLKGWVVSGVAEETFKDVNVIIHISYFEEKYGLTSKDVVISQIIKDRQIVKDISEYADRNVKIIIAGPSTKASLIQMYIMSRLEPNIPSKNFSAVTLLDEAIARAHLAARLKTTTNKIKNIAIWGMTCPDVLNATVLTYPPGDVGALEKVEVPVNEALQDDNYLHGEFVKLIFKRKIGSEFIRSGKSLAVAIARHLSALFQDTQDEIISMGLITPVDEPFMVPKGFPFSFPVTVKDRICSVRKDLKYSTRTHLNLIRTIHSFFTDKTIISIDKVISYIMEYEETHGDVVGITQRLEITQLFEIKEWDIMYYLSPLPSDAIQKINAEMAKVRKSIAWNDANDMGKKLENLERKSSIRFSNEKPKKEGRKSCILKNSFLNIQKLPPINPESKRST